MLKVIEIIFYIEVKVNKFICSINKYEVNQEKRRAQLLKVLEITNKESEIPVDLIVDDKLSEYMIRCKAGELKNDLFKLGNYDGCFECKEQDECINYVEKCRLVNAMQRQFKNQLNRW